MHISLKLRERLQNKMYTILQNTPRVVCKVHLEWGGRTLLSAETAALLQPDDEAQLAVRRGERVCSFELNECAVSACHAATLHGNRRAAACFTMYLRVTMYLHVPTTMYLYVSQHLSQSQRIYIPPNVV